MTFRVEISAEAERDAEEILNWRLEQQAGETGLHWFLALEEAIASLAKYPERCPLAPENARFPFEVRHLLYGRKPHVYRILFNRCGRYCLCAAHSPWPSETFRKLIVSLVTHPVRNGSADVVAVRRALLCCCLETFDRSSRCKLFRLEQTVHRQ